MKPVKKIFVYKRKLSLSLRLLYLVDLFINKLKTKFNNPFYKMILNTKTIDNSFWENFRARAKQMSSKVLFVGKKKRRPVAGSGDIYLAASQPRYISITTSHFHLGG